MKILTLGKGFVADHLPYQKYERHLPIDDGLTFEERVIDKYKPDVVINCIGKTGRPNVDWCESHQGETSLINTALPLILADVCGKHSIRLIQIGSGCIYFGESPNFHYLQADGTAWPDRQWGNFVMPGIKVDDGWKETDFANPKSYYSKTKYACDLLLGEMKHVTTLRIRMPISSQNVPRNLINKLRGYKQVIDIPNSVTFMDDLAACIVWVIEKGQVGTFHVTNPEPITAAQVMTEFQKYVPTHTFEIINEEQLDKLTVAKRSNCIINADKLKCAGFTMTPSKQALQSCMARYVQNL